jgi:processive 1,2-diacylglycerol beta-glucosyltransferase
VPLRVAILSADVAGGHDAAAETLRDGLLERHSGAEVTIDNGLAAAGTLLHRFIRDGFRIQLQTGGGSFDAMLFLLARRPVAAAVRRALGRAAAGGVGALLRERPADVVVSTYPVVTQALGELRARGELETPVAAPIMDAAPHPLWLHPAVDLHLVPVPGDVPRVHEACPGAKVRHTRPLLDPAFLETPERAEARRRLGLAADETWVLVDHSAWNVPPAHALVDPVLARTDARAVVLAAGFEDEQDVRDLRERYAHTSRVEIRDDPGEKVLLNAACDVVLTTVASTTAFAALVAGTPAVVFRALPGHGEASAREASRDGLVLWARTEEELAAIISGAGRWPQAAAAAVTAGRTLLEAPHPADEVASLAGR